MKISKKDKTQLIKNFFSLASTRGLEFLIPLLTVPYLVRTIGIENFGLISLAYAYAAYFGTVTEYGFKVTATRDISRNRQNSKVCQTIYSECATASLALGLANLALGSLLGLLMVKLTEAPLYLYLSSLALFIIRQANPIWIFQGMERMSYITKLNLLTNITYLALLVIFVKSTNDTALVPTLHLISTLCCYIATLIIIKKEFSLKIQIKDVKNLRKTLAHGFSAFVNQAAPMLYNNSSTLILGISAGAGSVGLYSAATRVIDAASSMTQIASNSVLPFLSRRPDYHKYLSKIIIFIAAATSLFLITFAGQINEFLYKNTSDEITLIIRLLGISPVFLAIIITHGTNKLMLDGRESAARRISLNISIIFFIISIPAIIGFGAYGAAATLIGARVTMAAFFYISANKSLLH